MKRKFLSIFIGVVLLFVGILGILNKTPQDVLSWLGLAKAQTQNVDLGFVPYMISVGEDVAAPTLIPTVIPLTPEPTAANNGADLGEEEVYEPGFTGIPDRIVIKSIELDAPVQPAESKDVRIGSTHYQQWLAPDKLMVGWHTDSVPLGTEGNTVLNGHHNVYGEVFKRLVDLKSGDLIQVYSGVHRFDYRVTNSIILPERFASMNERLDNARWLAPSLDTRLTLITCWPYESNTHRLIVVAQPVAKPDETN